MKLPLEGIRVLDIASMMAGPYGATLLGDMGADVIKIEPPYGDDSRYIGARIGNDGGFFVGINRSKRGMVLDLTTPEGRELYFKLVKTADIVIENLRPKAKAKLGLTYEEAKKHNDKIICIAVSAFGQDGPYANRPGIDPLAQALSGYMSFTGERGRGPIKTGPAVADATCANLVAFAAMMGLWVRSQQGFGQQIEVNMLDGMIHMQPTQLGQLFLMNYTAPRVGNANAFAAPYGSYTCKDGKLLEITSFTDKFFGNVCKAIEREDLAKNPRYATNEDRLAHQDELDAAIQDYCSKKDSAEMMRRLIEADVLAAPINTLAETVVDPQVLHNGMIVEVEHGRVGKMKSGGVPIKMTRTPGKVRLASPTLGQHTDDILKELGLQDADIARLRQSKIINDTVINEPGLK